MHKDALQAIDLAIEHYNQGYYNQRDYVEEIRQLYPQQLSDLKKIILTKNND